MQTNCDSCMYYCYDEEFDEYYCEVNLDEDEMMRFLSDSNYTCSYYRLEDEYKTVRKQMWLFRSLRSYNYTFHNLLGAPPTATHGCNRLGGGMFLPLTQSPYNAGKYFAQATRDLWYEV